MGNEPMSEKDRKIGERILDATAPMVVTDTLSKLTRKYGTERVAEAVKSWLAFIEGGS
jgi:hypothetical protein